MESHQPNNDPIEISPSEKKKRAKYIALVIVVFFAAVIFYMLFSLDDHEENRVSSQSMADPQVTSSASIDTSSNQENTFNQESMEQ